MANIGSATISVIGDASGLTRSLQRGLQNAFKGAVGVAAAAAVTGVFVKGIQAANAWEKNVLRIFQLLPTYSDAAFKEMQGDLVELATSLGANLQAVTTGVYEAVGKGFEAPAALKLVEEAAKTAIASGADLNVVVDGLTSTINAYGQDVLSAKEASAVLFQTFNLGGASVEALASQLYDVTPTAASLGISFKEVGEALAVLTAAGVPARVATTQLRTAFNELSKTGSAADKNFRAISGLAFPEFVKQGGSVSQALNVMVKSAKESGQNVTNLFTSANVAGQGLQNLSNRTKAYISVQDKFDPSILATKVQRGFDIAAMGAATTLQRAKENFNTYRTSFFSAFQPLSKGIADLIYGAVNVVGPALNSLAPKVNAALTPIVAGFKAAGPEIGQGIADAAERIGAAIGAVAAAIQQVWPSVEPILIRLRDAWNEIYPAVQNFVSAVIGAMPAVASAFQGVLAVVGPVIGVLISIAQQVIPPVINAVAEAVRWLSQFNTAWAAVGGALAAGVGAFLIITRTVGLFWAAIQRVLILVGRFTTALRLVWRMFTNLTPWGRVVTIVFALIGAFTAAWKSSETFREVVAAVVNAITGFLFDAARGWLDLLTTVWSKIAEGFDKSFGALAKAFGINLGDMSQKVDQFQRDANAALDAIQRRIHITVTTDASQALSELEKVRQAFEAATGKKFFGPIPTGTTFKDGILNYPTTPGVDTDISAGGGGGGGGGGLGPSGSDFPEEAAKKGAAAAKAAAKALATSLRSIGKALDAIARDTGRKTVDQLNTLFRTATERMQDGIRKAGEAGNKAMKSLLQGQLKVLQDNQKKLVALAKKRDGLTKTLFGTKYTLDEAKDFLADLRDESTKFIEGVRTSITALGAVTRDTGGIQSTFTGMRNNLRKTIAQTNLFIAAMKKLDAVDLNKTAQKQLLEAFQSDPTEGLRQAQLLARSGRGGVGEINKLQAQLDKAAGSLATSLNSEFHDAGIKAAEGLVKGLQTQHDKIAREMDKIADVLVNRIKTKLKIKSPSQVFADEIGMQIPAGVSAGVRSGMPAMLRSITDMSRQAVTFGPGAVTVNGVSDPVAARRAGILAGEGISDTISDMRSRAVLNGTGV